MAESTEQNNQKNAAESNEPVGDFDDFCKNFTFSDKTTCYLCNGYCGPNNNQPVCKTCHKVVFPSFAIRKRPLSGNDVGFCTRPYKFVRYGYDCGAGVLPSRPTAEPLPSTSSDFMPITSEQMERLSSLSRMSRPPLMLKDLNAFFGIDQNHNNEMRTNSENVADNGNACINDLPVEILSKIFADLDVKSFLVARKVSRRWEQTADAHQRVWKKITEKRWPLLERKAETHNWYKMYKAMRSSCCCRLCFEKFIEKGDNNRRPMVSPRAKRDIQRGCEVNGIRIIPLNGKLAYLQASIVGPPDSPYEGGKFFLQIHMKKFPFQRPTIKFLTKIIHPNISRHGDIGLDVLTWKFSMAQTVSAILLSIQSLLGEPFTRECMEPQLGRLYDDDRRRFDALARHWTKKYAMMEEIIFDN